MGRISSFIRQKFAKLAPELATYPRAKMGRDLAAGVTVGIVALPLSLALAIATGVPPIMGLYTAGIAGFLAALFAGSPYSVSGPAAAMVPILSVIISQYGLTKLPYITILAALFLAFFALLGLGKFIHKVPESVVLGFTAGIAFVLFCGQLNSFLGLHGLTSHHEFVQKLWDTLSHIATLNWATLIIGGISLAIILFGHRIPVIGKAPTTLIAIVAVTLLTILVPFFGDVATLGSVYGKLQMGVPAFNGFDFSLSHLFDASLVLPALKIAALIAVETLLCAVVADRLTKTHHRPNQELFAQSLGNLGSAFFGGIPATAVIARTGTIIKSGAATRLASVLHAIVVLAFVIALAPLAAYIPLTALSAVLLVTAVRISEVKEIKKFIRSKAVPLSLVLAVTLTLTVVMDLVVGVISGLLLHLAFATHGKLRSRKAHDGPQRLSEDELV